MKSKIQNRPNSKVLVSLSLVFAILLIILPITVKADDISGDNSFDGSAAVDTSTPASGGSSGNSGSGGSNSGITSNPQYVSGGVGKLSNPLSGATSVGQIVGTFAQVFTYIVVLFGVLALIWTGLQYILAQGKPDKLTELNKKLLWIVIGIAIVIGARIIVGLVINTIAATGAVNPNVIQQAQNAARNN